MIIYPVIYLTILSLLNVRDNQLIVLRLNDKPCLCGQPPHCPACHLWINAHYESAGLLWLSDHIHGHVASSHFWSIHSLLITWWETSLARLMYQSKYISLRGVVTDCRRGGPRVHRSRVCCKTFCWSWTQGLSHCCLDPLQATKIRSKVLKSPLSLM